MRLVPLLFALALPIGSWAISSCAPVPTLADKPVTRSLAAPSSGPMASASRRLASGRTKGESSVMLLENNKEALDWRLALVDSARSSVDIQLYLWHGGASGSLLFDRLLNAADRGVRVRILVDDFLLNSKERNIAAICQYHPNFDIRIFNPTRWRGNPLGSAAEFLLNFGILNRRMHNKTFTADRTMTIVGGRNIADHYFGLDAEYNFLDLDVLAAGPVVAEVSDGFDEFWNSAESYPGALLSKRAKPAHLQRVRDELADYIATEKDGMLQSFPVERHSWAKEFSSLHGRMVSAPVQFLQDDPSPEDDDRHVVTNLREMTNNRTGELILVSPYLIPSKDGLARLAEASEAGIEVGVLVPTLAANNQAAAHGHYQKHRRAIVEGGATLYELRVAPSESLRSWVDTAPVRSKEISLHMKTVVGDRERCFIGSLNLDPRAMQINTESGMLIDSPELSHQLVELLKEVVRPENAWKVTKNEEGKMQWESVDGVRTKAPPARWTKRMMAFVVGLLPLESQL